MEKALVGALLLRPLFLFLLLACVTKPADRLVRRCMKEGRLKRLLLTRLGSNR